MNITYTIASLPTRAKKQAYKSLVASLNQSIIGYARAHIRVAKFASIDMPNTIDRYNESIGDAGIATARDEALSDTGIDVPKPAIYLCKQAVVLRNWLEAEIQKVEDYTPQYDAPFSVANSLAYRIQNAPKSNLGELEKQAEATGIPLHRLLAAGVQMHADEHTDLKQNASLILSIYDECSAEEPMLDEAVIESLIDAMPIQAQYKMAIKLNEIMIDASNRAVKLMLTPRQRGSREASGEVLVIDAVRAEHFKWLQAFDKKHASALDAYAERAYLPILPDAFDEPIAIAMQVQSAKENPAVVAEAVVAKAMTKGVAPTIGLSKADAAIDFFNKKNMRSI